MLKEEHQQKLKRLRESYRRDDSPALIDQLEADLSRLAEEKEVLSHPHFRKFAQEAAKKVNDLNAALMNDEELWNVKGMRIAHQRDLWRSILEAFGVEYRDEAIAALEATIDDKLSS